VSTSPNAAQIAYWNGPIGQGWAKAQEKRDRDHAGITRPLLEWCGVKPGEHVLDVGCGFGTTTLMLAERVGRSGRVLGIDLSGPMLALAKQRAESASSIAQFVQADASDYLFEKHAYDLGFSQLGVMFFADPVAAFRNIRRGLKKRGRLAFACWRSPSEHLWASIPESAAKPFLGTALAADPLGPDACRAGVAVFDGRMRYDLKLDFKRMETVKAERGYRGPVVVCALYFAPVAGYIPDRPVIKYLAAQRSIEIAFAPVAGTRVLVPFWLKVPTPLGPAMLEATQFITQPTPPRVAKTQ